jgi:hypothetical protein
VTIQPLERGRGLLVVLMLTSAVGCSSTATSTRPIAQTTEREAIASSTSTSTSAVTDAEQDTDESVPGQSATGSCGVERWYVKTGMDADAAQVSQVAKETSIATLIGLPKPRNLPQRARVGDAERTIWRLRATVTDYKLEQDSDIHLVLRDGSGNSMIAELPDVACIGFPSPFKDQIRTVRSLFDARYRPSSSFQSVNAEATITGVGFFDFLHGQRGVAPNGIELHPVLSIDFDGSVTPPNANTSTTAPSPSPTSGGSSNARCDSAYPDFCIPPPPPDLNCKDLNPRDYPGAHKNFSVRAPDPHEFDADHDGLGCESGIGT